MGRRRVTRYAELTSLLDVLFILLFASLIQAAGLMEGAAQKQQAAKSAEAKAAKPEPAALPPDAGPPPDAAPPASHQALRKKAMEKLMRSMGDRQVIYARVSAQARLTAIERQEGGVMQKQTLDVPLLEKVDDPDVAVVYVGDRSKDLRLCSRVRVSLGLQDLSDRLIVVAVETALAEMPVALVEGLRRDRDRCFLDERGVSVLVTP